MTDAPRPDNPPAFPTVRVLIDYQPPSPSYRIRVSVGGAHFHTEAFCFTYWGARWKAARLLKQLSSIAKGTILWERDSAMLAARGRT